jgi:hypothetical protein
MDARQLLQSIEARGGVATVKTDATGAAKINVAPRSLALDLLPDLQRFKPALLELLTAPAAQPAPDGSPFRRVNPFVFVPATIETAPGVVKICEWARSFRSLFAAARRNELPQHPLTVEINADEIEVENAAAACIEIERAWTDTARRCQHERRDLTAPEADALDAATQFLDEIAARWDGAAWLSLADVIAHLDADFTAAMKREKARAEMRNSALDSTEVNR